MQGSFLAVVITGLVFAASGASAEEKKPWKADAGRGEALSVRLCANCHLVDNAKTDTAVAGIPTLRAVASLEGMTRQRVTNALINPHAPMPDMQITMHEIGDIVAYLEKLIGRELDGDLEKEPAKLPKKPKYPSPS
jgi:mono/diheme cytochrome c family protein